MAGGNYVGQYYSLLALIYTHTSNVYYFITECYAVHHITYELKKSPGEIRLKDLSFCPNNDELPMTYLVTD